VSAVFPSAGKVRQLDKPTQPDEVVRPEQMGDPTIVARLFGRILQRLASLERRFFPQVLYFEDITVDGTGTTIYSLEHKFGSRVRFSVVDWNGAAAFNLRKDATSTNKVLVLTSTSAGKKTSTQIIRFQLVA